MNQQKILPISDNKIIFPVYNSFKSPKRIDFILEKTGDDYNIIKLEELKDTPYYRLPTSDIDVAKYFKNQKGFIVGKKYMYTFFSELSQYDYHFSRWVHLDGDDKKIDVDFFNDNHLNYYLYNLKQLKTPDVHDYNKNHDIVLKFCNLLDGKVWDKHKSFNPYTKTGRLRDVGANSITASKELKTNIKTKGVKVEIDVDGFHLRIISRLMNFNLPKNEKAIDFLKNTSDLDLSHDEFKKELYRSFYSESFDLIDNEFFRNLKKSFRGFNSVLDNTTIFNYKIQQHEIFEMANMVINIPSDYYHDILFYTYDGLTFDVKAKYVRQFLEHLKLFAYPFTVEMLGKKYFLF